MNEALKPCPFCGGIKFDFEKAYSAGGPGEKPEPFFWVLCLGCFCTGPQGDKKQQAIAAWNTRKE